MLDDEGWIQSVSWRISDDEERIFRVGHEIRIAAPDGREDPCMITRIVVYREAGQGGHVPWVAVYVRDGTKGNLSVEERLLWRADCAGACVSYA
ncbi:MAG: hypothetical protein GY769_08050 [bacterium]|nr:hypothetical protein [bacterium]